MKIRVTRNEKDYIGYKNNYKTEFYYILKLSL